MEELSRAVHPPRESFTLLPVPAAEPDSGAADATELADPEALYRRHGARVSRWAARLAGPGIDVDDIVHDVFLVVLRRWKEFRGEAQASTWLHEITIRVVQTHRRKRRLRAWLWPFGGTSEVAVDRDREAGLAPEAIDDRLSPLESLERRQAAALLYQFLDQLDDKYRTAVVLFELEGIACQQIAALTGTSVANVWARLSRGREQLIRAFAKWDAARPPQRERGAP